MRCFAALAILGVALACNAGPTDAAAASLTDTYILESVDRDTLPAHLDPLASASVVSGALTLQPNGYFVLAERDSIWTGRGFSREDYTDGGTWTVDGSMLILSDTASGENDAYGAAASIYFGRIAPHTVLLTIATDHASGTHVFEYAR
jgi:hypothetical protein